MPPHRERLARLTETAALARTLFDQGWTSEGGALRPPSTCRSHRRPPPPAAPPPRRRLAGVLEPRDATRTTSTSHCLPSQGRERVPASLLDDRRRPRGVGTPGARGGQIADDLAAQRGGRLRCRMTFAPRKRRCATVSVSRGARSTTARTFCSASPSGSPIGSASAASGSDSTGSSSRRARSPRSRPT